MDVAIRGGGLEGAHQVVVDGDGLKVELNDAKVKVDPEEQKVFTAKCGMCHELRGPANISRTADQWVATVDRMIKDKGAPIETADRAKIVNYVQAAARAAAGLTARVTVAPDAAPGIREIRVVAANGTSTVYPFEVTRGPEALEAEPNNEVEKAPVVELPLTVSGQLANSDADNFAFNAKQGQRLVFNCYGTRMNAASQGFMFPVLYLYDAKGKELARNNGYFGLDPLIDWTAPADGKYVVQVRDMLYRGSPASVYRLSMGALPYKTYLFPPGGKRGGSASVTLHGQNVAPTALQVPVPANQAQGVRKISTPHGLFPFVAGDYPEWVEEKGSGPHAVSLPVSLNGRIQENEADRYTFSVAQENLGVYTFEVFANRLDSPLVSRLVLKNAKGQALASDGGTGPDARIDYNFTQPGEYSLEVLDAAGRSGDAHVYRISAGPADPDFAVTITPDNPNLGPGSSVFLQVRVQRRVGIPGDIEVSFGKLPPGVTASPVTLRPGENQAFAVLTAAPDAKPGPFSVADVTAKSVVNGKTVTRDVIPYEIYRINNNVQTAFRSNLVVTVGPEPEWLVHLEPGQMQMSPSGAPVEVKVRLERKNGDRDMPFAIVGVPNGIDAPRAVLFKKGQNELTFTMKPTNNGIFAPRNANSPPAPTHFMLAVVNGREGEGMQMASRPVAVALKMPDNAP